MSTVQQISFTFSYSAKRLVVFQSRLAGDEGSQKSMHGSEKLKKLCETRWCSRAYSLRTFKGAFSVIVETLAHLKNHCDAKARGHKCSMLKCDFIITLIVVEYVLQYILPLCKKLQYIQTDLIRQSQEAAHLKTLIRGIRVDECIWEQLYTEDEQLAQMFDIQLSKPRSTARQTQRANMPAETPSEHWKRAMFFSSTDHVHWKRAMFFSSTDHVHWKRAMFFPSTDHVHWKRAMFFPSTDHVHWKRAMFFPSTDHVHWKRAMFFPSTDHVHWKRAMFFPSTDHVHWKRAIFFSSTDHVCTELEDRLSTDQDRFVALYLIPFRLQELTPNLEAAVFLPFNMDCSRKRKVARPTCGFA